MKLRKKQILKSKGDYKILVEVAEITDADNFKGIVHWAFNGLYKVGQVYSFYTKDFTDEPEMMPSNILHSCAEYEAAKRFLPPMKIDAEKHNALPHIKEGYIDQLMLVKKYEHDNR